MKRKEHLPTPSSNWCFPGSTHEGGKGFFKKKFVIPFFYRGKVNIVSFMGTEWCFRPFMNLRKTILSI